MYVHHQDALLSLTECTRDDPFPKAILFLSYHCAARGTSGRDKKNKTEDIEKAPLHQHDPQSIGRLLLAESSRQPC